MWSRRVRSIICAAASSCNEGFGTVGFSGLSDCRKGFDFFFMTLPCLLAGFSEFYVVVVPMSRFFLSF